MNKVYFANLDGLRFLAFFAVFLSHSFYSTSELVQTNSTYLIFRELGHHGIFGVDFFFVLSGFLITYLLLSEEKSNGKINIKNFYIRRVLRIWPLYFFSVFFGFVVYPWLKGLAGLEFGSSGTLWYYLAFLNNYDPVQPDFAGLGVLWSIAVEEQFYLFWPLLLLLFSNKNWFYIMVVLTSLAYTLFVNFNYYDTINCLVDLGLGGLLAYMCFSRGFEKRIVDLPRIAILLVYLFAFILFLTRYEWGTFPLLLKSQRFIFSLFFGFVILEQNYARNSFFKAGKFSLFNYLGKISYGLYVLHFIAVSVISKLFEKYELNTSLPIVLFIEPVLALGLSIVIAHISYKYYESPFLRLKHKFN